MKNAIRCCISCILPCGALDVIRIVHSNGRVEELSGSIKAGEIMKAHPQHVLRIPSDDGMVPKIVVVPPEAKLQRGKIYFLLPLPPTVSHKSMKKRSQNTTTTTNCHGDRDSHGSCRRRQSRSKSNAIKKNNDTISEANLLTSDEQYFSEINSENLSTQRDRRRGRVGGWRPHLQSIYETPVDG